MKLVLAVLLVLLLSACAHHPPVVDCDGHLTPINPPNPVVNASVATKTP